jgi:superfamily I DNA/RNA helicase
MAMTPDYLRTAAEVIGAASSLRDAATLWRARDPDTRVVLVDAMDMRDETPALLLGKRRVYLGTSNGHCWTITQQPEEATALILTQED